jgi:uncharacterized sulfatase
MKHIIAVLLTTLGSWVSAATGPARPNILWITCEDTGPHLGAYGDAYATTPNLDRLAARGMLYLHAWANVPVCAPARTTIISGLYPNSTGSEHMRSMTRLPDGMKMYPALLREAGYYCSNNSKEDYNLQKTGKVWDDSSAKAHWRNRRPGQPFFAVFNHVDTHESQIRKRPHTPVHDPAKVRVPAYHPDTPEVRLDWAQYYDQITRVDEKAGQNLRELEAAGLAEDTIVFFYGDHGSGMPRNKRYPYNSGLQVPLIVYFPAKFRSLAPKEYAAGARSTRLVSFIDLAPTVLSLVGLKPPSYMQGRAFLGKHAAPAPRYLFGLRGRMDERYDLIRSVRDEHFVYVRNYMPHRIYGQHVGYMFETPTTQVWQKRFQAGQLTPAQAAFWKSKPAEELYDLRTDPDEILNLADSPQHRLVLERFRQAVRHWILDVRDVSFLPEGEIHGRAQYSTPYHMGHDRLRYPLRTILAMAELASSGRADGIPELCQGLAEADSAVRYWAAMGLLMRGPAAVSTATQALRHALLDPSPYVRIVAAETLGKFGQTDDLRAALAVLGQLAPPDKNGVYVSGYALNAIDELGTKAAPLLDLVKTMPREDPKAPERARDYPTRLINKLIRDLAQ